MDWGLWAGFIVAALIVGLLPGPGVTSIVGYALTAGLRTALASVLGATVGNAIAMTLSLVGVGVLIAQWPGAFVAIKWIGAAYLVGIGLYAIITAKAVDDEEASVKAVKPAAAFWAPSRSPRSTRRRSFSSSPSRRNSSRPSMLIGRRPASCSRPSARW